MSTSPPTKPPRGVKQQRRETSSLLISVIRTLSASETNEERENEKAKLEKDYKISDQTLDQLVAERSNELTQVMQLFSSACTSVNSSRTRLRAARARLVACRGLLKVRREDLRRLWSDARTHKHALDMLTQIEQLVKVEKEVSELLTQGHFLSAAHVLQSALSMANTTLADVDALQGLRKQLEAKKQQLIDRTMGAVNEAIYRNEICSGLTRQGSTRDRSHALTLAKLHSEMKSAAGLSEECVHEISPEYEVSLNEDEISLNVKLAILIDALAVLGHAKEATEKMKVNIQEELLDIINIISQQIIDFGVAQINMNQNIVSPKVYNIDAESVTDTDQSSDSQYLVELLTSLIESFKIIASREKLFLDIWRHTLLKHRLDDVKLYTMQHYWNSVQAVLQLLLTDYLDIRNLTINTNQTTYTEVSNNYDINYYFTKKKPSVKKKIRLFKFSNSSAMLNKEEDWAIGSALSSERGKAYNLVCRPKPDNLALIYPILEVFLNEFELQNGNTECSLRTWIESHIKGPETERITNQLKGDVQRLFQSPTAFRETSNLGNVHVYTVILESWRVCERVARSCCGIAGGSRGVAALLNALIVAPQNASQHVTPPKESRAYRWLQDDDIVRFLQSLPNWFRLKNGGEPLEQEDLIKAYEREAEILGSSLGDGVVHSKEIIDNINTLKDIAVMCESTDWLRLRVKSLNLLCGGGKLPEHLVKEQNALVAKLEQISDTCLLLLHLEVRIECFHYLGGSGGTREAGGSRLATALRALYQHASEILSNDKLQYVINGVGEMMSAGVVWAARGGSTIPELAPLRHCLAALELSATALHRAAEYLHILQTTPEEILETVKEKGPQFTELEYLNALNIIGKSQNCSDAEMKMYLNKLSNLLGHVGVTV